jgi:hypothetical protein
MLVIAGVPSLWHSSPDSFGGSERGETQLVLAQARMLGLFGQGELLVRSLLVITCPHCILNCVRVRLGGDWLSPFAGFPSTRRANVRCIVI